VAKFAAALFFHDPVGSINSKHMNGAWHDTSIP
jgi:hypothetical protein